MNITLRFKKILPCLLLIAFKSLAITEFEEPYLDQREIAKTTAEHLVTFSDSLNSNNLNEENINELTNNINKLGLALINLSPQQECQRIRSVTEATKYYQSEIIKNIKKGKKEKALQKYELFNHHLKQLLDIYYDEIPQNNDNISLYRDIEMLYNKII